MDTLQAKDGVTAPPAVLCPKGTFTKAKCGAFDQLLRLAVPEDKFIKTAHNLQYRRKKKPLSKKQTELFERVKQCQAPDWSEMDEVRKWLGKRTVVGCPTLTHVNGCRRRSTISGDTSTKPTG